MARETAKEMGALPSPSEATRFSRNRQPAANGRTDTKWLRDLMSEAAKDDGPNAKTHREAVARHVIEVATKWEVVVKGHGDDAMPVASARDSIAAAELLWRYDLGRGPVSSEEARLAMAEHFRAIARDQFDILVRMLGDRLKTMTIDEMAELLRKCDRDPRRFLDAAEAELSGTARAVPDEQAQIAEPSSSPEQAVVCAPGEEAGQGRGDVEGGDVPDGAGGDAGKPERIRDE